MNKIEEITRDAVLKAIEEFDRRGTEAMLEEYGFGKAKKFTLIYNGNKYPSKAIMGVAHQYVQPGYEPLQSDKFGGGRNIKRKLEQLGFEVIVRK